jgi:hypothetical protein
LKYPLYNHSNLDLAPVKHLFDSFLPFATKYLSISKCPEVHLVSDKENAQLPLGKTAFYNPDEQKITIFTDNRHIKDILRSLSHELVHHMQNLQGMFDGSGFTGPGYAQENQHLRDLEREAYEKGNLCLRDWEDKHKKQLQESIYTIKGDNSKMSYKNWRNQEVNDRLMESWGYKAPKAEILTESVEIEEGKHKEACPECENAKEDCVCPKNEEKDLQEAHCSEEIDEAHCGRREDDGREIEDEEGEIEEAKQFANDDTLDGDKDGKPKWADPDDPANKNEAMVRKTIREAITKALKRRSED